MGLQRKIVWPLGIFAFLRVHIEPFVSQDAQLDVDVNICISMAQTSGECTSPPGFYNFDQHIEELVYEIPGESATVNVKFDVDASEDVLEVSCRKNVA